MAFTRKVMLTAVLLVSFAAMASAMDTAEATDGAEIAAQSRKMLAVKPYVINWIIAPYKALSLKAGTPIKFVYFFNHNVYAGSKSCDYKTLVKSTVVNGMLNSNVVAPAKGKSVWYSCAFPGHCPPQTIKITGI